jgi:hypothetical protein
VALGSTGATWEKLPKTHPAVVVVRDNMEVARRQAAEEMGSNPDMINGPPSSDVMRQSDNHRRRAPAKPYSAEERALRIDRWQAKLIAIRHCAINVKYLNRRNFAVQRGRQGGRFVKKSDEEKRAVEEAKKAERALKRKQKQQEREAAKRQKDDYDEYGSRSSRR